MPNTIMLKLLLLAYLLYVGKNAILAATDGVSFIFVACWLFLAGLFAAGQFSVRMKNPSVKVVQRNHAEFSQNTGG